MTDVAGLVIGVAAMWKGAVALYNFLDTSRRYGSEYELLKLRLDIEQQVLLKWGETVGLERILASHNKDPGRDSASLKFVHERLKTPEVRILIIRTLGAMWRLFIEAQILQEDYNIRNAEGSHISALRHSYPSLDDATISSYLALQNIASTRQRTTSILKKALWALGDRRRLERFVEDLQSLNAGLQRLVPETPILVNRFRRSWLPEEIVEGISRQLAGLESRLLNCLSPQNAAKSTESLGLDACSSVDAIDEGPVIQDRATEAARESSRETETEGEGSHDAEERDGFSTPPLPEWPPPPPPRRPAPPPPPRWSRKRHIPSIFTSATHPNNGYGKDT
jgi:hypothetical protein